MKSYSVTIQIKATDQRRVAQSLISTNPGLTVNRTYELSW